MKKESKNKTINEVAKEEEELVTGTQPCGVHFFDPNIKRKIK